MTNLSVHFKEELEAIKAAAQANVDEAKETLRVRNDEVRENAEIVADLQLTAKTSKRAFFSVIRSLLKMFFSKAPDPEEVKKATSPCNTYMVAAKQLPDAEAKLGIAKVDQCVAEEQLLDAEDELEHISFLL